MADSKKFYDVNGNEIGTTPTAPIPSTKQLFDVQGNPLGLGVPKVADPGAGQKFEQGMSEGAPYLGKLAVNSLPLAGSAMGPEGTVGGTMLKTLLKSFWPGVFGEAPSSPLDLGVETGRDLLLNNAIPAGIAKAGAATTKVGLATAPVLRNMPGVREGVERTITNQVLDRYRRPESQILERGAESASQKFDTLNQILENVKAGVEPGPYRVEGKLTDVHPEVQRAAEDLVNTFGPSNAVGPKLLKLQKEVEAGSDITRTQEYKDISNQALRDIIHVQNWKLAAGPEGIQDLAINKLLQGGFKAENGVLDATKILNELGGKNKEIYTEAIQPDVLHHFQNFVNEIHAQQSGHGLSDAVVRWSKGHILWTLGGLHVGLGPVGLAATGVNVTNKVLSKWMENPETAQAVVQAMRTPAGAPEAGFLNQILQNSFKGATDLATVPEK